MEIYREKARHVQINATVISPFCLRLSVMPDDCTSADIFNSPFLSDEINAIKPQMLLTHEKSVQLRPFTIVRLTDDSNESDAEKQDISAGLKPDEDRMIKANASASAGDGLALSSEADSPDWQAWQIYHDNQLIQTLRFNAQTGDITFPIGEKEIYGLGQGFATPMDRRGHVYDLKRHGQEFSSVLTHAAISAVPYVISREGWALFFHQPVKGTLDLTGDEGVFIARPSTYRDLFLVVLDQPQRAAEVYYALTGRPPLPPRYAFGYQQSYRELLHHGESIVLPTAQYMREHDIPCDVLIYLGRYIEHGWNTYGPDGMFTYNEQTFPDMPELVAALHEMQYKVVLHITDAPSGLHGDLDDEQVNPLTWDHVKNYWRKHVALQEQVCHDGWWPDDGDELDLLAVRARHKMYHDGTEQLTPGKRGFYMLRNAWCGDIKYGAMIWSGDVLCKWETLRNQVQIGLNVSMSLSPYWGSDIGGFHVTDEYSGELYIRWFQYSVFTPMLRSHGRHSFLHTPWGWTIDSIKDIPDEWARQLAPNMVDAVLPDYRVEPICKRMIELRYQLLPYFYALAYVVHKTGLPFMRPMWFSFPDDERAGSCSAQYMLGDALLVSPVTKKGATLWDTYLPEGIWYDYFTGEKLSGGKVISKKISIEDIPVYVRAGGIVPQTNVRQAIGDQPVNPLDESVSFYIYEGADGDFTLYEDDGITKDYLTDGGTLTTVCWNDAYEQVSVSGLSQALAGQARCFEMIRLPSGIKERVEVVYQKRDAETQPGDVLLSD